MNARRSTAPYLVRMHCQFPGHGYLRDFPPRRIARWKDLLRHSGLAAHRDLRCFHQQIAQQ
jgi:hypothetical protein